MSGDLMSIDENVALVNVVMEELMRGNPEPLLAAIKAEPFKVSLNLGPVGLRSRPGF
jgi:hypothetical protein